MNMPYECLVKEGNAFQEVGEIFKKITVLPDARCDTVRNQLSSISENERKEKEQRKTETRKRPGQPLAKEPPRKRAAMATTTSLTQVVPQPIQHMSEAELRIRIIKILAQKQTSLPDVYKDLQGVPSPLILKGLSAVRMEAAGERRD